MTHPQVPPGEIDPMHTEPVSIMVEHAYISTGCLHGFHERCRLNCKHCGTGCLCSCHLDVAPSSPPTPEDSRRDDTYG